MADTSGFISGCGEGCPDGFHLECVEDDSPYPSGIPWASDCQVFFTGFPLGLGRTAFKDIGDRLWLGGESLNQIGIVNKDGSVYKTVTRPTIGVPIVSGGRFGQFFEVLIDKVVVWSDDSLSSTDQDILYVYDLNGNYLEYWVVPEGYRMNINGNIAGSPISANSTHLVFTSYFAYNPANNRYATFILFDYNGVVVDLLQDPQFGAEGDGFSTVLTDEIMMSGNLFSKLEANLNYCGVVMTRSPTTSSYISTVDRGKTPEGLDHWGASLIKLESPGLDEVIMISNGFVELGSNSDNFSSRGFRLYDKSGVFIRQVDMPTDILPSFGTGDTSQVNFGYATGVYRYGDYILVGVGFDKNISTTLNARGGVFLFKLDGTYVADFSGLYPLSSAGDSLGSGVIMDKDNIYQIGGWYNTNHYIKICPITWG